MAAQLGRYRLVLHELDARLKHSVITNAHVRRSVPAGCISIGPAPKLTWAASPGAKLKGTVTSSGRSPRTATIMRYAEE